MTQTDALASKLATGSARNTAAYSNAMSPSTIAYQTSTLASVPRDRRPGRDLGPAARRQIVRRRQLLDSPAGARPFLS